LRSSGEPGPAEDRLDVADVPRGVEAALQLVGGQPVGDGRVSGEQVDLYPWAPDQRYDVVVASLYQMPNDPFEQIATHRPLDYWGRNLVDHFIRLLPRLLAEGGAAYLMQLSILSQLRTVEILEEVGLTGRVVDFGFFFFGPLFKENTEQIRRVEQLSDAYHLELGGEDVMVAYLVEVTRKTKAD